MQSIDLIEIYPYGTAKDLVSEAEEVKCNRYAIKDTKMNNFDDITKKILKKIVQIAHTVLIMQTE